MNLVLISGLILTKLCALCLELISEYKEAFRCCYIVIKLDPNEKILAVTFY